MADLPMADLDAKKKMKNRKRTLAGRQKVKKYKSEKENLQAKVKSCQRKIARNERHDIEVKSQFCWFDGNITRHVDQFGNFIKLGKGKQGQVIKSTITGNGWVVAEKLYLEGGGVDRERAAKELMLEAKAFLAMSGKINFPAFFLGLRSQASS